MRPGAKTRALIAGIAAFLLGLTAAFNLMGGLGTSCVAFAPESFGDNMARLAPYRWLYIGFVVAGTLTAVYEAYALYLWAKRRESWWRNAVASLLAGTAVAGIHTLASVTLRGSGQPATMRFYLTAATLVFFLLAKALGAIASGEREARADGATAMERPPERSPLPVESAALCGAGVLLLVIERWMSATHMIEGIDYSGVWHAGIVAFAACCLCLAAASAHRHWREHRLAPSQRHEKSTPWPSAKT